MRGGSTCHVEDKVGKRGTPKLSMPNRHEPPAISKMLFKHLTQAASVHKVIERQGELDRHPVLPAAATGLQYNKLLAAMDSQPKTRANQGKCST